jgi:hypothetical protein
MLSKREGDVVYLRMDFTAVFSQTVTLSSPSITCSDSAVNISDVTISGMVVEALYSGGTPRLRPWCVTVSVDYPGGTRVGHGTLQVKENC